MGERPDEIRRDPLDPLDEGRRDPGPLADPDPDPALAGGAVIDDAEVPRGGIELARPEIDRTEGTSSTIVGIIRSNPLPVALTGIGLGWLFMNRRGQGQRHPRFQDRRYAYDYPRDYEERGPSGPSAGRALDRAQSRVGETANRAQDRVGETASRAQDRAGQIADRAQARVSRLGDRAQYQARRASGGFQRMLRENPLTVGALAVGLGAGVGLAVPQTAREHEVMGEARDNLVEKAQEKTQDAQQRVQRVAEEAQSAARQEADNRGLTNR